MRFAVAVLVCMCLLCSVAVSAQTAADILKQVKSAEAAVKDVRADLKITSANKGNVSEMGYGDVLMLEKGVVYWKKPSMIRYDGYSKGIKATLIFNGYKRLILAAMVRKVEDLKNDPGKRQDSLDLGFLSSQLWVENTVTTAGKDSNGALKLKFDPKQGDKDKRHDLVWIDPKTLKILKRQKFRGNGQLRIANTYSDHTMLAGKLPIAKQSKMYNSTGEVLGTVEYSNVKANTGLSDSLFSLKTK